MNGRLIYRLLITKIVPFLARYPFILILGGILYFLIPVDLIPEAFTGVYGFFDDLLLFLGIYYFLKKFRPPSPFTSSPQNNKTSSPSPYKILGVPPSASDADIKKAYRQKMAEYHPDKVAHLGDDLKKVAAAKTLQIQQAYESLSKN